MKYKRQYRINKDWHFRMIKSARLKTEEKRNDESRNCRACL